MNPLTPIQYQIVREIYKAAEGLGAGIELLAALGSWGDTLEEDEILALLEDYNANRNRLN